MILIETAFSDFGVFVKQLSFAFARHAFNYGLERKYTLYIVYIGGFRNSQSDVIFAHAHNRGRQRFVQLYGICVKCGFIF